MQFPIRLSCILLCFTLLGCGALPVSPVEAETPWTPEAVCQSRAVDGGALETRSYTMENQDLVQFGRFTASRDLAQAAPLSLPRKSGTIWAFVPGKGWRTLEQPGRYVCSLLMAGFDDGSSLMAYPPQKWQPLRNSCRRFAGFGGVELSETELRLYAPAVPSGGSAEYTLVSSRDALLDWSNMSLYMTLWTGYANDKEGRWCFDGYYWPSPGSYVPSGANVYYPMTDAYLCKSYLYFEPYYRLAADLALPMLDVMAQRQNAQGFFPTQAESAWLSGDYGIGAGFYDTRFNTGLMELYCMAYLRHGLFREVIDRYVAFYLSHAEAHHTATPNGGWLVEDYSHPAGGRPTLTALNHQLAEILLLCHLSDALGDNRLQTLAGQMIKAIEDTEAGWVLSDHNLNYAFYPDGRFSGQDYPYLTYNDLYELQKELERRGAGRNAALDRLMAEKRAWMDANGITEYKK